MDRNAANADDPADGTRDRPATGGGNRARSPSNPPAGARGSASHRNSPEPKRRGGARRAAGRSVTPASPRMIENAAQGDRVQDANRRRAQVSDPTVQRAVYDASAAPRDVAQAQTSTTGGGPPRTGPSGRRSLGRRDKGNRKGKGKGGKDSKGKSKGRKGQKRGQSPGDRASGLAVDADARAQRSPGRADQQQRAANQRTNRDGPPAGGRDRGGRDRSRTRSPRRN